MADFWQALARPFFILAPMEDVTDTVFRQIVASCGRPDAYFTEFTSADGLVSRGRKKVGQRLVFTQAERPIVAQLWGLEPKNFYTCAREIAVLGFDGIDLNFGCPERSVVVKGAGAALIKNQPLAHEIIQATHEGAGGLPISVKTRIGYAQIETEPWIDFLLTHDLNAITIHGRTAKEMSAVPVHWDEIAKARELRNHSGKKTLIVGNGDVRTRANGETLAKRYSLDGIMIGRGIFEDPWVFENPHQTHKAAERLQKFIAHIDLFTTTWGETKNFLVLRKFVKTYVSGFTGASELRVKLMAIKNNSELKTAVIDVLNSRTDTI
jgi:tRNA-dihydrouridine synthase